MFGLIKQPKGLCSSPGVWGERELASRGHLPCLPLRHSAPAAPREARQPHGWYWRGGRRSLRRGARGESARHEDAQKRLISATAAAQKRRVRGLAYESPAALRGWRSGEQAGTCSAVLGAAGESRERGRGWPPRAAKAKYRTIFSTGEATRRSNGPGQPREAAPRKSRKPRNGACVSLLQGEKNLV